MPTREWMARNVDTKGRPCPVRLAEACPGTREGCAWWVEIIIEDVAGVKSDALQGGCGLLWNLVSNYEVRDETRMTQQTLNKTATAMAVAGTFVEATVSGLTKQVQRLGDAVEEARALPGRVPAALPNGDR